MMRKKISDVEQMKLDSAAEDEMIRRDALKSALVEFLGEYGLPSNVVAEALMARFDIRER